HSPQHTPTPILPYTTTFRSSNADVRKGFLKQIDNLNSIEVQSMINKNAVTTKNNHSVLEMLHIIKKCNFPVMYLPVINDAEKARSEEHTSELQSRENLVCSL